MCAVQEHIQYSFELACQEHFLGEAQRRAIAQAAVRALQSRTPPPSPQASPRTSGGSSTFQVIILDDATILAMFL